MLIDTGNPPFKGQKVSGSIWPKLAELGFKQSDRYFATILPNRWPGHTTNLKGSRRLYTSYFRDTMLVANLGECQRHFVHPDGKPIALNGQDYMTYVVCDKQRSPNQPVRIITRADDFKYDISQMDFLPCINAKEIDYQIVSKMDAQGRTGGLRGDFYGVVGLNYKSDGQPRYFVAYAHNLFYDKCYKFYDWGRLTDEKDIERHHQWYAVDVLPGMTEESIRSVMEHPIVYYYLSLFFIDKINLGALKALPAFDLSKVWDEDEIFDDLGLTTTEKERVYARVSGSV